MELQAGITYAGKPGTPYTANNKNGKPYIVVPVDITHRAENGTWVEHPAKPDGKSYRAWVKWYITEAAWPYTEEKLRALQFNGSFVKPAIGVPSIVVVGEQNGKYINWDTPREGDGDREAIAEDLARKLTARYQQNNPKAQDAPSPPVEPQQEEPAAAPEPDPSGEPPPVDAGGEAIPF